MRKSAFSSFVDWQSSLRGERYTETATPSIYKGMGKSSLSVESRFRSVQRLSEQLGQMPLVDLNFSGNLSLFAMAEVLPFFLEAEPPSKFTLIVRTNIYRRR